MQSPIRKRPKDPLDHEPEAVVYARNQAGLTQTELASRCNVTQGLISEIEAGTRNATPAMIRKLATALNCPRVILERKRDPETAETSATRHGQVPALRNDERPATGRPEMSVVPQTAVTDS